LGHDLTRPLRLADRYYAKGELELSAMAYVFLGQGHSEDQSKGQRFVYPTLQRHDADKEQKMSTKKIITHRTPADGNIFADLGFAPEEAKRLLAEADQAIDEKRAIKQTLMTEIVSWIDAHNLKQAQAAEILGITRPRVSDVVNQKTPKFTVDSLVDMVLRTGKHVQLSVQ
jgi:predicted XRE-type DNA-binding protein